MLKEWSDKEPDPPVPLWRKVALYGFLAASVALVVLPLASSVLAALSGVLCTR
jgi:hypothetical protein